MGVLHSNFRVSKSVYLVLCFVLFMCLDNVKGSPHGLLLNSLLYGGRGGVSPTSIDGHPVGSRAVAGSHTQANAASYASTNAGTFNFEATAPFGLGLNFGLTGAQSSSAANSGAFSSNGGQNLAYIDSHHLPSHGSGNTLSAADSHLAGGVVAGTAGFEASDSGTVGNQNIALEINKNHEKPLKHTSQPTKTTVTFGLTGGTSLSSPGASTFDINSMQNDGTGSVNVLRDQQKTEGGVIIMDVSNSGAAGGTFDADFDRGFQTKVVPTQPSAGGVMVVKPDLNYPQTSYGYVPEGQTNMFIDGSLYTKDQRVVDYNQGSNIFVSGSMAPAYGGNYDWNSPLIPTDTMVIVGNNKNMAHNTFTHNTDLHTSHVNSDHTATDFYIKQNGNIGGVSGPAVYPKPTNTKNKHPSQDGVIGVITIDTGLNGHPSTGSSFSGNRGTHVNGQTDTKFTGSFGGSPGILGDQRPPGYAVNKHTSQPAAVGVNINTNHNHVDSMKYTGSFGGGPGVLGDQRPPGYAFNKDGTQTAVIGISIGAESNNPPNYAGSNYNYADSTKYTGSFGGAPGILGDQKPAGYAFNKDKSQTAVIGINIDAGSNYPANYAGSNVNYVDTSKYTGSFGGGPGVLGDQRPPGYAVNKGSSASVSFAASNSQAHSNAGTTGVSGQNTIGFVAGQKDDKYTGSFGGGPGILGDQRPPGYAVNKDATHGVVIGVTNTFGQSDTGVISSGIAKEDKYTGSFGGAPGILGDQKPPSTSANTHAGAVASANVGVISNTGPGHDLVDTHRHGATKGDQTGVVGVKFTKHGSLAGELLKNIGAVVSLGGEALSSSQSGSVGFGASSGSAAYATAGASSSASSGCCG